MGKFEIAPDKWQGLAAYSKRIIIKMLIEFFDIISPVLEKIELISNLRRVISQRKK